MTVRTYHNFVLNIKDIRDEAEGTQSFTLQLAESPVGNGTTETRTMPKGVSKRYRQLDHRALEGSEIIEIGETLAEGLLGGQIGTCFYHLFQNHLGPEEGVRMRLQLPPAFALYPWEYMYHQRSGGEKTSTGFLCLDPRISITRQETMVSPVEFDREPKNRRLLAAFASPSDLEELDLEKEKAGLQKAFQDTTTNIDLEFLEDATMDGLRQKLQEQIDILHFAGHGSFERTGQGIKFGTELGEGILLLVNPQGGSAPVPADQLAINLLGSGLQLAVLSACESGKRDVQNVWSGVVAAIAEAEVPAIVAMQFSIWDEAAITFAHHFYQVLAAGLPLDYAVSEARIAMFNLCNPLKNHIERSQYWRDWGVPVLYLQADGDFLLPSLTEPTEREAVILYYKGWEAYRKRHLDHALDYLYQATRSNPKLSDAWETIVHIQQSRAMDDMSRRRYADARWKLTKAREASQQSGANDSRGLTGRGMVYKSLAQLDQRERNLEGATENWSVAEGYFQEAVNLDPKNEGAYVGLGNAQFTRGEFLGAIQNYLKAIDLCPRYTAAYHDLALVYEKMIDQDPEHEDEWGRHAFSTWYNTLKLAENDPSFSRAYIQDLIRPRLMKYAKYGDVEPYE
jgi:tetratricopeptide (TPR) repeat protein